LLQVAELSTLLESAMGLNKGWLLAGNVTVFLYVSQAKRIVGCVVAESIKRGSPVLPHAPTHEQQLLSSSSAPLPGSHTEQAGFRNPDGADDSQQAAECSTQRDGAPHVQEAAGAAAEKSILVDWSRHRRAVCGIRLMWVSYDSRRKGIAGKLLDCARSHVIRGCIIPQEEVAFTQPTAAGRAFIEVYVGTPKFLVYK
jgi:N-acetyltransferase